MASTTDLVPVHPMETYCASKDYALFEAEEIRPFMRAAYNQAALFKESRLPLVVSSGQPSIDNILNFLRDQLSQFPSFYQYSSSSFTFQSGSCGPTLLP
jgi:hypothetical protein